MLERVEVPLGERSYSVVISPDGYPTLASELRAAGISRAVLVTEPVVAAHWREVVQDALADSGLCVATVCLDVTEASKDVEHWQRLVGELLSVPIDRRTAVLALGGGVLGDVAGFAAATVLRGVPLVQLPTTLLAMVDSSVGGKTAVNHPRGKNLLGAFYQPRLVFAALSTLRTLETREYRAGLAEVAKTVLIGGGEHLERVRAHATSLSVFGAPVLGDVIASCVQIKASVVARDEREGGVREWLNLGHTVGHAVEQVSGFGTLRHGEAVAMGLVCEARWAARQGLCDADVPAFIAGLLQALGLPTQLPNLPRGALLDAMTRDKKVRGTAVTVPIVTRPGEVTRVSVPFERLGELLTDR